MADVVTVHIKGLDTLLKGLEVAPDLLEEESRAAMGKSVKVVKGALEGRIALGPGREGHLRSMISVQVLSAPIRGLIDENKFTGKFYEFGTKPHVITIRGGIAQSMYGSYTPTRIIHHPGAKGRHAMRRALRATKALIRAYFLAAAAETLRRIAKGG